jgi:hypothetical protein
LLAQVVEMAGRAAIFPDHWEALAELAMEHESARAALARQDARHEEVGQHGSGTPS